VEGVRADEQGVREDASQDEDESFQVSESLLSKTGQFSPHVAHRPV